jgi:hypothetical protein
MSRALNPLATAAAFVLASQMSVATAAPAQANLVARYTFQDSLASVVAGAPALVAVNAASNAFVTDTVFGNTTRVYQWGGAAETAQQGGLTLDTTGLVSGNNYSVAMTFQLFDGPGGWDRLIDVRNRASDSGLYRNPSGFLSVFPFSGQAGAIPANTYVNAVLTVGPNGVVNTYLSGGADLTISSEIMNILPGGIVNFFLDDQEVQREWSAGRIADLRLYAGVLDQDDVSLIANPVPIPASLPLLLGALSGVLGMGRRRG